MIDIQELYMYRCIQLAMLGNGYVAPNPMVGAILVYNYRIIGEGYHQQYGGPHAEVNCINSVAEIDRELIAHATLYVSLEPCAHYGKTPPCVNLIIENKIPRVVIGCTDLFAKVNGKGIALLKEAGVKVFIGVLENDCIALNKRFFKFHQYQRPYIILKWAQTVNGIIGYKTTERLLITNDCTNRIVHQWRSEEAAIMVGSNTVLKDNPKLNNRLWTGNQPTRFILDRNNYIDIKSFVLDGSQKTIIFNNTIKKQEGVTIYHKLRDNEDTLQQIMNYAYNTNVQSILVEGGATLLQLFIINNCWDEARVITNSSMYAQDGILAPSLSKSTLIKQEKILSDLISYYKPNNE